MKSVCTVLLALLLIGVAIGCDAGKGLCAGDIEGPDSVTELTSAEYTVTATGSTGITYQWAVDPPSMGTFANGSSATAAFNAGPVAADIKVKIQVVVNSDKYGPVLKEREVKILKSTGLQAGGIFGPSSVNEGGFADYSIVTGGDTGITYQWSFEPDLIGILENDKSNKITFKAGYVIDTTSVTITVTIDSDNYDPVERSLGIVIRDVSVSGEVPAPFQPFQYGPVLDIAVEGDSDIVIATDTGLHLFTPYGVYKRSISHDLWVGLATSNFGATDTGRGVMGLSPNVGACNPTPSYDDAYVEGGVPYVSYDAAWWAGEPDPYYPGVTVSIASSSSFSSCDCMPHPIAYHPETSFAYQKVFAPDCIADSDADWPVSNVVPGGGWGILAYSPDAPLPPDYMNLIFEGGQDFLVYYDYPTYQTMQYMAAVALGVVPACALHNLFIVWDLTTPNYMSDRDGMVAENIGDFEFDLQNRLIIAMPRADSVAITDPVVFGQPILIQEILGGRQNGMGTLPGEFAGPRAVAIDPRNQNILISDTGNGRVQTFDSDGNFIRTFGSGDPNFAPGAIRVDAWGTVYVANISPTRPQGDDLRLYSEYGAPVSYGAMEGWVYDQDTHEPVDSARVFVGAGVPRMETITDDNGHFIFWTVPSGVHEVTAEKFGYLSAGAMVNVNSGYRSVFDLYMKRAFVPAPGYGIVIGVVFSTITYEPAPGLKVEIQGTEISGQTNGNGEFTLYSVPEGEHILNISKDDTIYYGKYITVVKGEILDLGTIYVPVPS